MAVFMGEDFREASARFRTSCRKLAILKKGILALSSSFFRPKVLCISFNCLSNISGTNISIIDDDNIQRLMSFPNVLITAHQAFFTEEALTEIAQVTLRNIASLTQHSLPVDGVTRLA